LTVEETIAAMPDLIEDEKSWLRPRATIVVIPNARITGFIKRFESRRFCLAAIYSFPTPL
jgi:hypothetical protein